MRPLALCTLLVCALAAPARAYAPPERMRADLARDGLQIGGGGAAVEIRLASGHALAGNLSSAGSEAGGQGQQMFTSARYDVSLTPDLATASITITRYPVQGVAIADLDYDGPPIAAHRGITVRLSLPGFARGMAIHRYLPYWTTPVWASDYHGLPADDVMLLWQRAHRVEYDMLAPLAGSGMVGSIGVRDYAFGVTMSGHAVDLVHHVPLFVFASAFSPYELTHRAYATAFAAEHYYGRLRDQKGYPDALTRLGWCSWNAFYRDVTEAKILAAARSFCASGVPLGFVLIDDGWSTVRGDRLAGFGADRKRFPDGLAGTVRKLETMFHIRDVGVWHALEGYWKGVDPESPIGKAHPLLAGDGGTYIPDPQGDEAFYDDWYRSLARSGIDLVKVDNQGGLGSFTDGVMPIFEAGEGEQRNLQAAAVRHFGRDHAVNVLNCMDLSLEDVYNWHDSNVARTSNDYDPDDPLTAKDHVLESVYNSYWVSNFAYPDYDMFQSDRQDAYYQAVARAISGGPVYTADVPGEENAPLVDKLALADGTLLRVDQPGMPTRDCLLDDPAMSDHPLLVWSQVRRPGQVCGIVAAFNADKALSREDGTVEPSEVDTFAPAPQLARFAVYDAVAGKVTVVTGPEGAVPFWLPEYGADLFTIAPLSGQMACLGLLDKLVGPAAIVRVDHVGTAMVATLAQKGRAGFYCQQAPRVVKIEGKAIPQVAYTYRDGLLSIPEASFGELSGPVTVTVDL